MKGLESDVVPARPRHKDLTMGFRNATAATTIKNADKGNSIRASGRAGLCIYSCFCRADTMDPFGAEIDLVLSSSQDAWCRLQISAPPCTCSGKVKVGTAPGQPALEGVGCGPTRRGIRSFAAHGK